MDIVYILGKGSLSNDDELRYSIRSVVQNCSDFEKIHLVGDVPDWFVGEHVIQAEDLYLKPWQNMMHKVQEACKSEDVSENFLLMNDDFFANKKFSIDTVPFYSDRRVTGGVNGKRSFATHTPIRLNKEWFLKMPLPIDAKGPYSPRSFYGNFYNAPPTFIKDCIVRMNEVIEEGQEPLTVLMPPIEDQIINADWFTIDDVTMLHSDFRKFVEDKYNTPSAFEQPVL